MNIETKNQSKVVILVGVPGSGKSTFAKKWSELYPNDKYEIICQDVLGSRQICIDEMHELLEKGRNVIIDRCNVTEEQRSYWLEVALYHSVSVVTCIVLEVDDQEAMARVILRKDHPTITDALDEDKKRSIVGKFLGSYSPPKLSEGFSSIIFTRN